MSTFDTNSAAALNTLVKSTRAKQIPSAVEQRKVPRLSIDELNAMDVDSLREKYMAYTPDDRGPVEQFLDVLDAPRAQIFATLAPGLERRAREAGNTGAFGTGRVQFADVLGEMGLRPGIVRGVLGFVGDVAFDPLTYLGGTGIGAKIVAKSGRVIPIGKELPRLLTAADKAAAAGKAVPRAVESIAQAVGGAGNLRRDVLGAGQLGRSLRERAGRTVSNILRGEKPGSTGLLSDFADAVTTAELDPAIRAGVEAKMAAADKILQTYGYGAGPALLKVGRKQGGKIGVQVGAARGDQTIRATQSLFHVPFTDISLLSVPGFGATGRAAAVTAERAATTALRQGVTKATSGPLDDVQKAARAAQELVPKMGARESAELKFRTENPDAVARVEARGPASTIDEYPLLAGAGLDPDHAVSQTLHGYRQAREADIATLAEYRNLISTRLAEVTANPGKFNIGQILAMQNDIHAFDKVAAAHLERTGQNMEWLKLRKALLADEADRIDRTTDVVNRLAEHDATKGFGRPLLGIDPLTGETKVNADLNTIGQVSESVRGTKLLDQYDDAFKEVEAMERNGGAPTIDQLARGLTKDKITTDANGLREQLIETTRPLREGPVMAHPDEVAESIRELDRKAMSEANRNLVNMSDAEADAYENMTRAASQGAAAALGASLATRGSAIGFMSPEQMRLLRLHKDFLGTPDSIVGASTLAPLSEIAAGVYRSDGKTAAAVRSRLDQAYARLGETYRSFLGGPSGELTDQVRHALYMMNDGGRLAAHEKLAEMLRDMNAIAKKNGLGGKEPTLLSLATALAVKEKGGAAAYRTLDIDGKPTGFLRELERARDAGLLQNEELVNDLTAYVKKHDILSSLRDIEMREGALGPGSIRRDYLPNVPTRTADAFMQRSSANRLAGGYKPLETAIAAGQESFQKARTSDSAFIDSVRLGKKVEVSDADRWVQTMTDAEIEAIPNGELKKKIQDTKAALDEYDAMPARPPMLANDPFSMNAKKDRFRILWGADEIPGGFMDTNYASIMADRLYQHERAMAKELFKREVMSAGMLAVGTNDIAKMANAPPGSTVRMASGLTGKLVQLKDGPGIRIGDDIFRPIHKDVRGLTDNPLLEAIGDNALGAIYHQHLAERIEGAARLYTEGGGHFWKAMDRLTSEWKRITLLHPSWWIANVIGESINYAAQDTHFPAAMAKYAKRVAQMFRLARDPEGLGKLALDVAGTKTTAGELLASLKETPIIGAGRYSDPQVQALRDGMILNTRMEKAAQAMSKSGLTSDATQAFDAFKGAGGGDTMSAIRAGGKVVGDRADRFIFEPWQKANVTTSDMLRTIAYLSFRDRGWDHGEAIRRVVRAGFDYQDLSPFEKQYARRLIPFWAWLKNNSIYQAKLMLDRPMVVGSLPLLQRAVEEALDGEGRIPMEQRPKWVREQLGIQAGGESSKRTALLLGSFLPQEQALLVGRLLPGVGGLQDVAKNVASSINPLIRAPLEVAAGKEFFSDRTIGEGGDMSIGEHAAGQIRPVREASKLASTLTEQGVVPTAERAVLGGRVQPFSNDRIYLSKSREYQKKEDALRKSVRTAEFRNNPKASVQRRAELLKLYEVMIRDGHEAEVPQWAKRRLASFR